MVFPTHVTTVSPSSGLRPVTVVGNKTRPTPPRPLHGDATGGTQSAEYPTVDTVGYSRVTYFDTPGCRKSSRSYSRQYEGLGIPVDASSASGWEGPVDRAVSVAMHVLGHNWTATVEGSRESVLEPRGNTEPQTPPRGILAL